MKEVKKNPSMTYEEVLQNTDLAHFHEAIHLLQNRAHTAIFPRQYESAMMSVAEGRVVKLFERNPAMPLKTVVSKVMARFPNDLSAALISKITEEIMSKWTRLSLEREVNERFAVYI